MIAYPKIPPELISFGFIRVRWYGLMYVIGYVVGFRLLKSRAQRGLFRVNYRACESWITYMVISMLLGARLFYVLLYNWDYYSSHLIESFAVWQGGLSFHGAAAGMTLGCYLYARRFQLPFYMVSDSLCFCAAPGLFFGRMGNFINGELFGRPTTLPWAMIFPTDPRGVPRHPSQLYEALGEGLLLSSFLYFSERWAIRRGQLRSGLISGLMLVGYGVIRFGIEFTREPDPQLGFVFSIFSMGQILCALMILAGIFILWHSGKTQPAFAPEPSPKKFLNSEDPASIAG